MKTRVLGFTVLAVALALVIELAGSLRAQQLEPVALTGHVSSAAEGGMEGVLVNARQLKSPITVTVVSDAQGRYRFPASRLAGGAYELSIRAIGYDLAGPSQVAVAGAKTTTADLRLVPTQHLEDQLSDGEWLYSAPGTEEQKTAALDCTGCHSMQRIVDSYHTADEFRKIVLPRMATYNYQSFWLKPQTFKVERRVNFSQLLPEFFASINQSAGPRKWPLRTFPRLKGPSTRVIITRYDLPSHIIQPHDVVGTRDGMVWFSDFGTQQIGRLNPATGAVKLFAVPTNKPDNFTGALDIELDPSDNLWLANMTQGQVVRFDTKTLTFTAFPVPPGPHPDLTQESMVGSTYSNVDGKIWTNNQDDHSFRRLDPKTGTWDTFGPFYYPNSQRTFNAYGMPTDTVNGVWGLDFGSESIAHLDPAGNFKIIPTPTKNSHPRRGHVDPRTGLLWFAEFTTNRVGSIDTKSPDAAIKEYIMPTPWDAPYDAEADKNGNVWVGSMLTDRITRLNPATGRVFDYQLPSTANTRRVWIDNSATPVKFWTGANHEGTIMKLEPQS